MNKAEDFLGVDIVVGDLVIYQELNYRSLGVAKISKITPHCVFLDQDIHDKRTSKMKRLVRQDHSQVVKMEDQSYHGYAPF